MAITLDTLDGEDLNPASGEWTSWLPLGSIRGRTGERDVKTTPRTSRASAYAGSTFKGRTIQIVFKIAWSSSSQHESRLQDLEALFTKDRGEVDLVFTEEGTQKKARVVPVRLQAHGPDIMRGLYMGILELLDDIYLSNAAEADVGPTSYSSSPASHSVTNNGTVKSYSGQVLITPTAQKAAADGQRYRRRVTVANRVPRRLDRWPVDLADRTTGGAGWDTATEITAGRMQSDGDDVEAYLEGTRVDRWFAPSGVGAINRADTKVWINAELPPERHWTQATNGATLAAGATTLPVEEVPEGMPAAPFFLMSADGASTEVVRVTAYDREARELTVVRAQRGTSGVTHADGTLWYLAYRVDLVFGGTSLPAQEWRDDNRKPILNLSTSNNASHVFADFADFDAAGDWATLKPRAGSWLIRDLADREREKREGDGDRYLQFIPRTQDLTNDAAPASAMCLAYRSQGAWAGHPLTDRWEWVSPIGVTQVAFTETTSTLDFSTSREARLAVRGVDADGNDVLLRDGAGGDAYYDGDAATAKTASPYGGTNIYAVAFVVDPFDPKRDSTTVEILAGEPTDNDGLIIDSVTMTLDAAEEPLIVWDGGNENIYQIGRPSAPATLADADGDTLSLYGLVLALNDALTLDLDTHAVTIGDGTGLGHRVGGTWPGIPAGTKNLTFTESGLGTLTLELSAWRSAWN